MSNSIRLMTCIVAFLCTSVLHAQTPPATKTVAVLVVMTAKPGVERSQVSKIVPEEVKATLRLYLEGKIREWFSRSDGNGVVFIMDSKSVAEAQAVVESLPLARAHLVDHQFTELSPLAPLTRLLDPVSEK